MNSDIELSESQIAKKEEILSSLKQDINKLSKKVNNIEKENKKIAFKRGVKKGLCVGKKAVPYILTGTMFFSALSLAGHTPFIRSNYKSYLRCKKEIDSLGNIRVEEQYRSFEDQYSTLIYASKWNKNDDGIYSRSVKEYYVNFDDEELLRIVKEKDIYNLDTLISNPRRSYVETKINISEEELLEDAYLEARIFSKDKKDLMLVKETDVENVGITGLYLFFSFIIGFGLSTMVSKKDLKDMLKEIEEKYPDLSYKELKQELELKMDNYKVLTRSK